MLFTWTLSITFQQTEGACGAGLWGSFERAGSEGPAAAGGWGRCLVPAPRRHQQMPTLGGANLDLGRGGVSGCDNRSLRCRVPGPGRQHKGVGSPVWRPHGHFLTERSGEPLCLLCLSVLISK